MTAPATLAEAQRVRAQRLARSVADRLQERWRLLDPSDLSASWGQLLPGAVQVVIAGQVLAAAQAEDYVGTATGATSAAALNPTAFAGAAANGGSLTTLLTLPVIRTKQAIAAGQPVDAALARGLANLVMVGGTEVADAGRSATGVAITTRPRVHGHVRVVNLPACGRCVLLSGRVYRWSESFQRHPRCDCGMRPVGSEEAAASRSPQQLFAAMDSSEQERAFTVAGAKAIRDGADMGRVVNAQRGVYEVGGRSFTTEGTTRRGRAASPRLTPIQIYREAAGNRAEAIRLLRRHGYLTG